MANKSNWKGSEHKAAKLFPGGKRRPRVGGTYALNADDIIWGEETCLPDRVIKHTSPGTYIDVKKKSVTALVTEFNAIEKKYCGPHNKIKGQCYKLILITHKKGEQRQLVTISDSFFYELIRSWCREKGIFLESMDEEGKSKQAVQRRENAASSRAQAVATGKGTAKKRTQKNADRN